MKATTLLAAGVLSLGLALPAQAGSPVPGKPGAANLVEVAASVNEDSGEFSYLLAAATCDYFDGAIVNLLTGSGKVTLFAPTDDAFRALQAALGDLDQVPAKRRPHWRADLARFQRVHCALELGHRVARADPA